MSNPISSHMPAPMAPLSDDSDPTVQAHKTKSSGKDPVNVAAGYSKVTVDESQINLSKKVDSKDFPAPHEMDDKTIRSTAATLARIDSDDAAVDLIAVLGEYRKFSQQQRTSARETRFTEANAQTKSLMASAQKIRDGAEERLTGAVVGGALQIGSGLMQVSGGLSKAGKIGDVAEKSEKLDLAKENLGAQDKLLSSATKDLDDATKELDVQKALVDKTPEVDTKIAELETRASTLTQQTKELDEVTKELDAQKALVDKTPEVDTKIAELESRVSTLTQQTKELDEVTKELDAQKAVVYKSPDTDTKIAELETRVSSLTQAKQAAETARQEAADTVKDAQDQLRRADHALDNVGKKRAATTEMSAGIGTMARATQDRRAAEDDAEKAELEAEASVHGQASQAAADWAQQMMDAAKEASNTLASMEQSRAQTASNIARM